MTEEDVVDENSISRRPSAYVATFDETISFALRSNGNLWTEAETKVLNSCGPDSLPERSRLILSRLSLRKPKWIKSVSISHYVPFEERYDPDAATKFHAALNILEERHFVEYLNAKTAFETAFEVVEACFTLDDLTALYKRLTTQKNATNGANKPLNKDALVEAIRVAVRTQKTLFGQPLYHKFAQTVVEVLKELPANATPRFRSSFPPTSAAAGWNSAGGGGGARAAKGQLRILRIDPGVLHLLRRCQRLYQISCNASNNGHSGSTTSGASGSNGNTANYYATGLAAANNTSVATTGFASVLQPLEFNAPLLVFFRKVFYPQYVLNCAKDKASLREERSALSRIFASQKAFQQWEGAVELHAACLDKGIEAVLLDVKSSDRLHTIVGSFQSAALLGGIMASLSGGETAEGELKLLTQLLVSSRKAAVTDKPPAERGADSGVIVGGTAESTVEEATANVIVRPAKKVAAVSAGKKRNSMAIDLTALGTSHLLALLCLLSYTSNVTGSSETRAHDYLLKFDAGTQLTYAVSDGACQCEKEPHRQYPFAVLLYELLLQQPFLPHRRGYWYKRLCIDYAHLQLPRCALRACYRCLSDPFVNVSDKTEVAQRATALKAKLQKQTEVAAAAESRRRGGRKSGGGIEMSATGVAGNCFAVTLDFPTLLSLPAGLSMAAAEPAPDLEEAVVEAGGEEIVVTEGRRPKRRKVKPEQKGSVEREVGVKEEGYVADAARIIGAKNGAQDNSGVDATGPSGEVLRVLCVINTLPDTRAAKSSDGAAGGDTAPRAVWEVLRAFLLRTVLGEVDEAVAVACLAGLRASQRVEALPSPSVKETRVGTNGTRERGFGWKTLNVVKRATTVSSTTSVGGASVEKVMRSVSHTVAASVESSHTTAVAGEWTCQVCTFFNPPAQTIACAVCMHARPALAKAQALQHSQISVTVSQSAGVISVGRGVTPASSAAIQPSGDRKKDAMVVDLLSDSDDEVATTAVGSGEPITALDNLSKERGGDVDDSGASTQPRSREEHPLDDTLALLRAVRSQLNEQIIRTVAIAAPALPTVSIHSTTDLFGALNLTDTLAAGDDEEGTDLLLLGLLTPEQAAVSITERASLESIIPAPPFFVVHGKRIGDPSRKGKSQFCGLNGELMNVEEYVLQKSYAVDPDEVSDAALGTMAAPGTEAGAGGQAGPVASAEGEAAVWGLAAFDVVRAVEELEAMAALDVPSLDLTDQAVSDCGGGGGNQQRCAMEVCVCEEPDVEIVAAAPLSDSRRSPRSSSPRGRGSTRFKRKSESQLLDTAGTGDGNMKSAMFDADPAVADEVVATARTKAKVTVIAKGSTKLDNSRHISYASAIDGGGWQGWHCEGALFQSLFGLLMWEVLFTCPCVPTAGAPQCGCNVFVTPFQDAPLDLGHRSFFQSRRERILARIAEIQSLSTQGMIDQLGAVYRAHYGETCRGVHWGITLPLLQLMAVCMGGPTVAAVCRAMAVNFKHFTGGAPDLMVVRVRRRIVKDTGCQECGAAGTVPVGELRLVDVAELLGENWAKQMYTEVHMQPGWGPERREGGHDMDGAGSVGEAGGTHVDVEDQQMEDGEAADLSDLMDTDGNDASDRADVGADVEAPSGATALSAAPRVSPQHKNAHIADLFLPQLVPASLVGEAGHLWAQGSAPGGAGGSCGACASCGGIRNSGDITNTTGIHRYEYELEARFVEVKGPTDSLMFRQRVWLHILNQAVTGNGAVGAPPQALVCHVKE